MADPAQNFTDMFKKFGEQLKVQPFDMTKIMEHHQKNLEAMTKSWQSMAQGASGVATSTASLKVEGIDGGTGGGVGQYRQPVRPPSPVLALPGCHRKRFISNESAVGVLNRIPVVFSETLQDRSHNTSS